MSKSKVSTIKQNKTLSFISSECLNYSYKLEELIT